MQSVLFLTESSSTTEVIQDFKYYTFLEQVEL
jgi:hypothetical protein